MLPRFGVLLIEYWYSIVANEAGISLHHFYHENGDGCYIDILSNSDVKHLCVGSSKTEKTLSHISHFLEQENLCKFMNLFCERSSDFWRQNQNVWLQCCKMCFSNTVSLEEKVLNIRRRSEKTFGDLIWHHIIFLGGTYLPRELTTKLHFGRSFLLIPLLVSYFHICIMRGDWTSESSRRRCIKKFAKKRA